MSTITKLRRLPDGSIEHFTENTAPLAACACGQCTPTNRRTSVSVAEACAAVDAACEQVANVMENVTVAEQVDPFAGRQVLGLCMTPLSPDGKSGGVVEKIIRTGKRAPQEYALPIATSALEDGDLFCASAHHTQAQLEDARYGVPGDVSQPTAEDELARRKAKQKELQATIDDPATSDQARAKAYGEMIKVIEEIAAFELATGPRLDTHR